MREGLLTYTSDCLYLHWNYRLHLKSLPSKQLPRNSLPTLSLRSLLNGYTYTLRSQRSGCQDEESALALAAQTGSQPAKQRVAGRRRLPLGRRSQLPPVVRSARPLRRLRRVECEVQ